MSDQGHEIKALTGLRAVAAFWVVLFHLHNDLTALDPVATGIARLLAPAGYLGVDLFFILSGLVISYTYADRFRVFDLRTYLHFLWARLARIYPVHLFTLLVLVAFVAADDTELAEPWRYSGDRLVDNLLLVHGWALPIEKSWNVPSWSISTEWLAYLLFPLVGATALAIRHRGGMVVASGLLATATAVAFVRLDHPGTMAYGLIRVGVDFTIGCLLYGLYRQDAFRDLRRGLLLAIAYMAAVAGTVTAFDIKISAAAWAPVPLAMLVYGLSSDRGGLCRWLARPSLLYWGRVSYSLYMTHLVVIWILHRHLPPDEIATYPLAARAAIVTALVATILAVAALTYRWVEEPARRWMLARFARPATAAPTATDQPQTASSRSGG